MKYFYSLLLILCTISVNAQEYHVNLIPDSLKKDANAVKRFESYAVSVKSIDKVVIIHKYAITVLNEHGNRFATFYNYYDQLRSLDHIDGSLYDAQGKKIKSVKKKDIEDVSMQDGFSLMRDSRIKAHSFYYTQYPYTVEYEYKQEYKGVFVLPQWIPVQGNNFSVQESNFNIETPVDYNLRYKQFNYNEEPVIIKNKNHTYLWKIKNVKAIAPEIFQPFFRELVPNVAVAPTNFSYGGYTGNMSSWLSLGKFQVELNKGRDELPDNVKKTVHQLIDGTADTKEKIKLLYEYLQKNTRYISIQLGIGGLQPFDAKYVAANGYGDCKALSNYMIALLKEAGIGGYYTIIHAGEREKFYMPDFPSDQTNHIIVSVPLAKDTMWLECTSQTKAAGFLGSFTDDRYGLMIKEDGGYLVKTPAYQAADNLQSRIINASIDENGKLTAEIRTSYTGLQQEDVQEMVESFTQKKLLENLKKKFELPTYDVTDFKYSGKKSTVPSTEEELNLSADHYASVTGKRMFITPNILSKTSNKLDSTGTRKFDILYDFAFRDTDTVHIKIPEGYTVESIPKNTTIKNQFGQYEINFKIEGNMITHNRFYERTAGRFSPQDYSELVKFYEAMFKADRSSFVLVKKD